mmetsp:Transcript_2246/g.4111  ORF Transcript_2246/g.4111 Transcript_2246/m.4111 type:complete len:89 (+) Transcript_2246:800-1066(+)
MLRSTPPNHTFHLKISFDEHTPHEHSANHTGNCQREQCADVPILAEGAATANGVTDGRRDEPYDGRQQCREEIGEGGADGEDEELRFL